MNGIERIKVLSSEIKDKPLLKIVNYLLTREDMNDKYLNEEKSLKQMIDYIKSEAKKQAENGVAMLEDEEVYGLAIHYFDEPNDKLNIDKKEISKAEITEIEKPKAKKKTKNWIPEGQLSLFDL